MTHGFNRLRAHPAAESVRQDVLNDQHKALEAAARPKRQDPPRQNAEPVNSRDSRKITLLVAGNPKHGKAKARFALYRNGMTVAAYRAAVGERQGSADIRWDTRKNYIRIE